MQSPKHMKDFALNQALETFATQRKGLESLADEYKAAAETAGRIHDVFEMREALRDITVLRRRFARVIPDALVTLNRAISLLSAMRRTKTRKTQIDELLAYQARYTAVLQFISHTHPVADVLKENAHHRVAGNTCANQELEELYRLMPYLRPTKPGRQH